MIMRPNWSALRARVSNRLAKHFCTVPFRLRNKGPVVNFKFDDTVGTRRRRESLELLGSGLFS
jgi:hypothetical protein